MPVSPLYRGAPAAASPRAAAAFALLDSLGVDYQRIEHDRADTMELCAAISDALGVRICKNLFLCNRSQTVFCLLCMPEDKPFHTKDLGPQIGTSRLSFAPEDKMEELLGCSRGSCSVLGLMNDADRRVRLVFDREVVEAEWFACHPCDNTGSVKFRTKDLLERILPHTGHSWETVEL